MQVLGFLIVQRIRAISSALIRSAQHFVGEPLFSRRGSSGTEHALYSDSRCD